MRSLLQLRVVPGEEVSAGKWNDLLDHVRSLQILGGPEVTVRRTPHGTFVCARPQAASSAPAWVPSLLTVGDGRQAATVSPGLIEGVRPVIGEDSIFPDPEDPAWQPPRLALPAPAAAEGYLYLRCTLARESWRIERAEIVFEPAPPAAKEWEAAKLLAILRRAGQAWEVAHQAAHFNLGHYAYGRKASGKARHLWFAR